MLPARSDIDFVAVDMYKIDCRDRRLDAVCEEVFSPKLEFPSLKFVLLYSYPAFLVVCLAGMTLEGIGHHGASVMVAKIVLTWLGLTFLAGLDWVGLTTNPTLSLLGLYCLGAVILAFALMYGQYIYQPAFIVLDSAGLTIMRTAFGIWQAVDWRDVQEIDLVKDKYLNRDNWIMQIVLRNGKRLGVRCGTLRKESDRAAIIKYVREKAPQATICPELLLYFNPGSGRSYTEMWLQALEAPPARARLSMLDAEDSLQNGSFVITGVAGVGGQGVAYLAQDCRGDASSATQVVLKETILPVFGDENTRVAALASFEKEANLLARLEHRQIVRLLGSFVEDHRGYLILEYVNGTSLQSEVETAGPLPQERVVELAGQMLDILAYLHGLAPPLVHRDFTPHNLMLGRDGKLTLIDLAVAHEQRGTTTATVVGKHAYLPPEQFRGKPCPASDIYALGGTLHFLLTGMAPEPLATASPIALVPAIDPELSQLVSKCTQTDLSERYESVSAVRADLQKIANTLQVQSLPPG